MRSPRAWVLLLVAFGISAGGLVPVAGRPSSELMRLADPHHADASRVVFLVGKLPDEERMTFTAALAGSGHPGVLLFNSERSGHYTRAFLREFQPSRLIPVGSFAEPTEALKDRLGTKKVLPVQGWPSCRPEGLWKALFPRAQKLVVCPARPRGQLLQAACLAGALQAPLFISQGLPDEPDRLAACLKSWPIREIHAVGAVQSLVRPATGVTVYRWKDAEAVAGAYLRLARHKGVITTLIVVNPDDLGIGGMSVLGPWLALRKNAQLLLTNREGTNVESLVESAVAQSALKDADSLIVLANLQAIPMQRRPNPLPGGKDRYIEMEPMTPHGRQPFSFAVGRLFHEDLNVVLLMQARPRLWQLNPLRAGKALMVSNPGGGLPLLETFSRTTADELANAGYDVRALCGHQARRNLVRKLLPEQTLFLWEGHYSTLVRDYQVPEWTEPMRPSLVFLQSCLALTEDKAQPFLRRGACAVVGSSTRTYSGSGGAFTLAYFDAMVYDRQSLGGSLRQAKNFLLAFSLLKQQRLGQASTLGGANLRTAWAFTLWGDPTLQMPVPQPPARALPRVEHQVRGRVIHITLPEVSHDKTTPGPFASSAWANGRLGGLLKAGADSKSLVPLVFAEVHLPSVQSGQTPRLRSRLPGKNWVFTWDARRHCGYVLAIPRCKDRELKFHIEWTSDKNQITKNKSQTNNK